MHEQTCNSHVLHASWRDLLPPAVSGCMQYARLQQGRGDIAPTAGIVGAAGLQWLHSLDPGVGCAGWDRDSLEAG